MAHYYSSLYEQAPFRGGPAVMIPRNPNVNTRAQDFAEIFTFSLPTTVTLQIGDVLHLIPSTPAGFRITRLVEKLGDFDSGTTLAGTVGFLSGSGAGVDTSALLTSLQTGAIYTLADTTIMSAPAAVGPQSATLGMLAPGANDELVAVITVAATGPGTAVPAQFLIEAIIP